MIFFSFVRYGLTGEYKGKLPDRINELIGGRNAAYVVGFEAVPYLEALIPRHRRNLIIDEHCRFVCDIDTEILGGEGQERGACIRHKILARVSRRNGKVGLHKPALAVLRLG